MRMSNRAPAAELAISRDLAQPCSYSPRRMPQPSSTALKKPKWGMRIFYLLYCVWSPRVKESELELSSLPSKFPFLRDRELCHGCKKLPALLAAAQKCLKVQLLPYHRGLYSSSDASASWCSSAAQLIQKAAGKLISGGSNQQTGQDGLEQSKVDKLWGSFYSPVFISHSILQGLLQTLVMLTSMITSSTDEVCIVK